MEIENIKTQLKNRWKIDPYDFWIPLKGNPTENTFYFETSDFEIHFGYEKLNEIVNRINHGKVYSFNESREEKIYDKSCLKEYDSPDIFFTNENADWVIYQTHEETISFAGKELVEAIKSAWINWQENVNPWE